MIAARGLAWPRCLHVVTGVTGSCENPSRSNPLIRGPCDGRDGCDRLLRIHARMRARIHARTRARVRHSLCFYLSHLSHPSQRQKTTNESAVCGVTGCVTGVTG